MNDNNDSDNVSDRLGLGMAISDHVIRVEKAIYLLKRYVF